MTIGYPTKSGAYWVRVYAFNSRTLAYDIEDPYWYIVWVDGDIFQYTGNESADPVMRIYEYEEVEKPT